MNLFDIFGNLNALSLEPLGHIAGLGAAFVGAFATFMCLPLAWLIADRFDGTVYPLVAGFALKVGGVQGGYLIVESSDVGVILLL